MCSESKGNRKLVSVIVPVYNAEQGLALCIESVLRQTYRPMELILIDDGSTDRSWELCRQYAAEHSVIRAFHYENGGVSAARNRGMERADGAYFCFLDSDDYLDASYVETMVNAIESSEADAAFCHFSAAVGDRTYPKKARIPAGVYTLSDLSGKLIDDGTLSGILFGSVCTGIYRADCLSANQITFPCGIRINEDGIFNLYVLSACRRIAVTDYYGYFYRNELNQEKKPYCWNRNLDSATEYIAEHFSDLQNFELQMMYRKVSVLFWNAIKITKFSDIFHGYNKEIKQYIQDNRIRENYGRLCLKNMGVYKKTLLSILCHGHIYVFALLMLYAVPVLSRALKH